MKIKKIIQIAGLFLFIVGLPLGSYIYLKAGFDYHKEALDKLEDMGEIPADYTLSAWDETEFMPSQLDGNIVLTAEIRPGENAFQETLKRLCEQFEKSETAYFLFFLTSDVDSTFLWDAFLENNAFPDFEQIRFFDLRNERNNRFWREILGMSDRCEGPCKTIAFVDSKRQIRQYYDISDGEQLKELVRISAIMLPKKKVEDPELRREKEK
jgi:hypothetical protein